MKTVREIEQLLSDLKVIEAQKRMGLLDGEKFKQKKAEIYKELGVEE